MESGQHSLVSWSLRINDITDGTEREEDKQKTVLYILALTIIKFPQL